MKKILLFVGALLIVLVMFSGVTEGYQDDMIDDDKKRFSYFYDKANTKTKLGFTKNDNTPLKNLVFDKKADKRDLDALIEKYNNIDDLTKKVTGELTKDEAIRKLNNRKNSNSDE